MEYVRDLQRMKRGLGYLNSSVIRDCFTSRRTPFVLLEVTGIKPDPITSSKP
jgi:hypothetical protein